MTDAKSLESLCVRSLAWRAEWKVAHMLEDGSRSRISNDLNSLRKHVIVELTHPVG